jgi:aspartyl-tRNA(Asn)/glutamyl-tRNA(Gln) amidotransferase subunit B
MPWETVIGLEIHVQLATRSKLFSGAATAYGAPPNSQACAIDLALPGVLPVLNAEAVRLAVLFGLAIGAEIGRTSVFARKNYFYPDLPKGYQISQFEHPIVGRGALTVTLPDGRQKRVGITRAHLEEDAGKSLHEDFQGRTGIDLNRAGTPLLEIVSEPDLRTAAEAAAYMREIHALVRWLGISDGNMQEGSLRCDANVSVRPLGEEKLGTRAELKNLNSFRFIEKAILHEVERQIEIIEGGGRVIQETRLYDPDKDETRPLRSKEEAHDYRYFPDPDLLPVVLDEGLLAEVRAGLPELPEARRRRFGAALGLSLQDAAGLTVDRAVADYFEAVVATGVAAKPAANWVMGEVAAALGRYSVSTSSSASGPKNASTSSSASGPKTASTSSSASGPKTESFSRTDLRIEDCPVAPGLLGRLLARIEDGTISGKLAKQIFEALWRGEAQDVDLYIAEKGLAQVRDPAELARWVDEVIAANPEQIEQYRAGKGKVMAFLVGQIMKQSQGKAAPGEVNALLKGRLGEPGA